MATNNWPTRVALYNLELDIQTLLRDPFRYAEDLRVLELKRQRLLKILENPEANRAATALELIDGDRRLRVLADSRTDAGVLIDVWRARHPDGRWTVQAAYRVDWARPLYRVPQFHP